MEIICVARMSARPKRAPREGAECSCALSPREDGGSDDDDDEEEEDDEDDDVTKKISATAASR